MAKWIPVEKKMPGNERTVLVAFDDGFICTDETDESGDWMLWADSGEPTHWMPLPEPPKKDEGEIEMTVQERLEIIKENLKKEYSAEDYRQWGVQDIARLRVQAKFLLKLLTASQAREKVAIDDMKLIVDRVRAKHCDDTCCFACLYDGDFSIGQNGDYEIECPGFDSDECFKWRKEGEGNDLDSIGA